MKKCTHFRIRDSAFVSSRTLRDERRRRRRRRPRRALGWHRRLHGMHAAGKEQRLSLQQEGTVSRQSINVKVCVLIGASLADWKHREAGNSTCARLSCSAGIRPINKTLRMSVR